MDFPEYNADSIVVPPEAVAGAYLYGQAMSYAKAGQFEQAVVSAEAITQHNFSVNQVFKAEALLMIVPYCIESQNLGLAGTIAERIELTQYRDRAFHNVACGYVGRCNIAPAVELIDKIESPDVKAEVLSKIQKEMIRV